MKNVAIVAQPLTALTRKKMPATQLDWTSEYEEAFSKVKELLISAPIVYPPEIVKITFSVNRYM